jgi:hypothetical protein
VWSYLTFEIGSRIMAIPDTRTDRSELLRTLGFANAPGFIQVFMRRRRRRDLDQRSPSQFGRRGVDGSMSTR